MLTRMDCLRGSEKKRPALVEQQQKHKISKLSISSNRTMSKMDAKSCRSLDVATIHESGYIHARQAVDCQRLTCLPHVLASFLFLFLFQTTEYSSL